MLASSSAGFLAVVYFHAADVAVSIKMRQ